MPNPGLARDVIAQRLRTVAEVMGEGGYYVGEVEDGKSSAVEEARRRLGFQSGHSAVVTAIGAANRMGLTWEDFTPHQIPADPEDELPPHEEVLSRAIAANERLSSKKLKDHNRRIILTDPGPFAVAFIGDPHVDNGGTAIKRLVRDMEWLAAAGVRAINMGDVADHWPTGGRLGKKHLDSSLTREEVLSLIRWFVRDSGVKWDIHLAGNHDLWPGQDYAHLINEWTRGAKMVEWGVSVTYVAGDFEFRVAAHHDFPGHSGWNALHALMRRAREEGSHDLYVAGHRHTAAQGGEESGFRGKRYNYLRVKGYKENDEYAFMKGFPQQTEGASALAVVNPYAESMEGRCRTFFDFQDGLETLEMLRKRYA